MHTSCVHTRVNTYMHTNTYTYVHTHIQSEWPTMNQLRSVWISHCTVSACCRLNVCVFHMCLCVCVCVCARACVRGRECMCILHVCLLFYVCKERKVSSIWITKKQLNVWVSPFMLSDYARLNVCVFFACMFSRVVCLTVCVWKTVMYHRFSNHEQALNVGVSNFIVSAY